MRMVALLLAVVFLAGLTFRDAYYGALTILATFLLHPIVAEQTYGSFYRFHIPEVLYIVTLLAVVAGGRRYLPRLAPRTLPDFGMLAFLLMMVVSSAANGDNPFENRRVSLFFKATVLYFLLSRTADSPRKVLATVWVVALSVSYLAFVSWRKYRLGIVSMARPATWVSIHQFGMDLVIGLPMVGALLARRYRLPLKLVLIACMGLIVLVAMRTQSRSSYLGVALGLLLLGWYHRKRPGLLLLALPLVVLAVAHNPERVFLRLESIWTHKTPSGQPDRSIESRFAQMHIAFRIFRSHPFMGIGPDMFYQSYLERADVTEAGYLSGRYNMHSIPLLILAEEGLAGIAIYYGLLMFGSLRSAVRVIRRTRGRPDLEPLAVGAAAGLMSFIGFIGYGLAQPVMWQISIYGAVALIAAAESCVLELAQQEESQGQTQVEFAPTGATTEVVFP